jgi:hypothetical protein
LSTAFPNRFPFYALANLAFLLIALIACASGGSADPRLIYLLLLFALCSAPVLFLDGLNGRYALLAIFFLLYFIMFGLSDVFALLQPVHAGPSAPMLTTTEAVVLVGGAVLFGAYCLIVQPAFELGQRSVPREWSLSSIWWVGILMWIIGAIATYNWYVYIVTDTTNEAIRKGLNSRSTYEISAYILAQMMLPLGILLIAYLWRSRRLRWIGPLVIVVCLVQLIIGFVADIKGMAMLGGILVIATCVFIDGRLPKVWLLVAVVFAIVVFPIYQTYRTEIHGNRGIARSTIIDDFARIWNLTLSANERVNSGRDRAQTFLERSSLLGSLQTIVEKTGNGVAYQHGYTLTPILATFVPKILWSDKPDIPTGQLVNKEFHFTDSDDIFISPSNLGELYWNFGWPGILGGMALIGAALGFVGGRFNLAHGKTVTRLLVTIVTIKQVVIGFESSIAAIYVVWLRSLAGIGLLHLIFARVQISARTIDARISQPPVDSRAPDPVARAFPNLMG